MFDPAAAVVNHFLAREGWARERLAQHAGQTFAIAVGPLSSELAIDGDGMLLAARTDALAPDVRLRLSPFDVPTLLADPSRFAALVDVAGDRALAATLAELVQTFPLFVERAFASVLGPIAGQRLADAGREMLELPRYAASRIADAVANYASDEAGVAARGVELTLFVDEVGVVAQRTETLELRIAELAARTSR